MLPELIAKGYQDKGLLFPRRITPLHAMLTSCGYQRETTSEYDWHGLKRGKAEFVLFQYTLSGSGVLRYEGTQYEVTPTTAMLLHFPHDNRYWLPPGWDHWEFIYLCLCGTEITRIWIDLEACSGPLITIPKDAPLITSAAQIIYTAIHDGIHSPFDASRLAYGFCMELGAVLTGLAGMERRERSAPIQRAIDFAKKSIDRDIGIDELAQAAGYSKFHFTRLFAASEGISPGGYLLQLKLRKSITLLQESTLSVKEIAARCGFYDAAYFCKVFRGSTGVSPTVFRKSGMF